MKLYVEPIVVTTGQNGLPERFIWRRKVYRIRALLDYWFWSGDWWTTPQLRGHCRHYYRVQTAIAGGAPLHVELCEEGGQWKLSKVLD